MFCTPGGKELFLPNQTTGELGKKKPVPVRIPGLQGITQIAAGANHALALQGRAGAPRYTRAGASTHIWSSGCDDQNQLDRRLVRHCCPLHRDIMVLQAAMKPVLVEMRGSTAEDVVLGAAGEDHAFAVGASGRTWAWGLNTFGETGAVLAELQRRGADGSPTVSVPTQVTSLAGERVVTLAGSGHYSAALTADGQCLAWRRVDAG